MTPEQMEQAKMIVLVLLILYILYMVYDRYYSNPSITSPPLGGNATFGWQCNVNVASSDYWAQAAILAGLDPNNVENCNGQWYIEKHPTCVAAGNAADPVPPDLFGAPELLVAMSKADAAATAYAAAGQVGEAHHQFELLNAMLNNDPAYLEATKDRQCGRPPITPNCTIL